MWSVPVDLITVCETDPLTRGSTTASCCEPLKRFYEYTGGHGAWVGRRLRMLPLSDGASSLLARDDAGCTWTLASPNSVTNTRETLDVETMLKRYVYEEYRQQAQDDLRYREKCVHGVYVPSPDLHDQSSDDDGIDD